MKAYPHFCKQIPKVNDSRNLPDVYPTKNISHKVPRATCNTPFLFGWVFPYTVRGLS